MDSESGLWRGVLAIVVTGALLGIAQNALVRASSKEAGLAWKWKPKELPKLPTSGSDAGDNPLGKIGPGVDIPDLGQPLEIAVELVREYVDTQTAAIIDARDATDFAAGHIPGAINMPFHDSVKDAALLASFDPKGRPILVYCGGATCELSKELGYALIKAGQKRVLVYTGGWPDWAERQYPIEKGT